MLDQYVGQANRLHFQGFSCTRIAQPHADRLLWVALVFGVGQVLEGSVLTPKLVGDRIGLHPVLVIFAVAAGGRFLAF